MTRDMSDNILNCVAGSVAVSLPTPSSGDYFFLTMNKVWTSSLTLLAATEKDRYY